MEVEVIRNDVIEVLGARENNLKNVDVVIPKNCIAVVCGNSGSGKSSLVLGTIATEAKRQLIETFSSFARQRLPKLQRPSCDSIKGISTAIVLDQKALASSSRSTVGTTTEAYTLLRLLFAKCGKPSLPSSSFSFNQPSGFCTNCHGVGVAMELLEDELFDMDLSLNEGAILHQDYKLTSWWFSPIKLCGLFDMDKPLKDWDKETFDLLKYSDPISLKETNKEKGQFTFSFSGVVKGLKRRINNNENLVGKNKDFLKQQTCSECNGERLNPRARMVKLNGKSIGQCSTMEISELLPWVNEIFEDAVTKPILVKLKAILNSIVDLGIGYLSLGRSIGTLSGGENSRIKFAKQIGCDLTGLLYVLDEPSVGLHPFGLLNMMKTIRAMRDSGNSVLVVEHEAIIIASSQHVIEMGPASGKDGGTVVFQGTPDDLRRLHENGQVNTNIAKTVFGDESKLMPWRTEKQSEE
eukprot:TRINITY_DN2894_c0_g1_i2.p1 TRINITY_DN2894_c0_g1~~TRINITY_DN2894_c0_g1_i2.p1  ORF type:complete len:482 (-),score=178.57 TRINITY_DN2894_c0_g1_i2:110-1507(-)